MREKAAQGSWRPNSLGCLHARKRGERLGTVEAKDIEEALKKAYEEYKISEEDHWRISVQRE
jgi:hypothetical protein